MSSMMEYLRSKGEQRIGLTFGTPRQFLDPTGQVGRISCSCKGYSCLAKKAFIDVAHIGRRDLYV
jgi:hypothetical protein